MVYVLGYIDKNAKKSRTSKQQQQSEIEALNYSIEDKRYEYVYSHLNNKIVKNKNS